MNEVNLVCFITNLAVAVLVGAFLLIIPALTRKSYLFGVKIPLEEHACSEAKNMKKRYATVCLLGTAVILALTVIQFLIIPNITLVATMYFPLLFVAVQMAAFVPNWKQAVKLKEERGWKVSGSTFAETKSSHSRGNLSELPWLWYALSLILILASVIIALVKYPGLPDNIPTHFDFNMQPDSWTEKSLLVVMMMPLINLATTLMMWLVGFMIVRAKLQIDPQNPVLSFAQHHIYRRRMGHGMGFLTLGLASMMALIGLTILYPNVHFPFWLMIALIVIPTVPVVVIPIQSGQGGCKIKPKEIDPKTADKPYNQSISGDAVGRGDDKYWALGLFYHNPDDPAYIVEDRFGSNFGFNYSRLPVKIGVIAALLAFVAVYTWITVLMCSVL